MEGWACRCLGTVSACTYAVCGLFGWRGGDHGAADGREFECLVLPESLLPTGPGAKAVAGAIWWTMDNMLVEGN